MTTQHADFFGRQERDREIATIRERLARLQSEKIELEATLTKLLVTQVADRAPAIDDAPVD